MSRAINRLRENPILRRVASVVGVRKCWPKEQHETHGKALAAARSLLRRGLEKDRERLHVYECACGAWHTGHGKEIK